MKSFLKGLRYIIHKFDSKEPEMKIGKPTDVKHVAHIGWDGPSTALPSWMSEFKSAPECSSNPKQEDNNLKSTGSKDSNNFSHPKQEKAVRHHPELPRPTRRHHRSSSNGGDPLTADLTTRDAQVPPKPSRRRRSSSGESSSDLTKPSRKQHGDEQNKDTAGVPKKSRRRKSKSTVNPNGSIESDHSIKSKSPRDPNRRKSADKLPQLQETNT